MDLKGPLHQSCVTATTWRIRDRLYTATQLSRYVPLSCLGLEWHCYWTTFVWWYVDIGAQYTGQRVSTRQERTACSDWHLLGTCTDGQGMCCSIAPGLSGTEYCMSGYLPALAVIARWLYVTGHGGMAGSPSNCRGLGRSAICCLPCSTVDLAMRGRRFSLPWLCHCTIAARRLRAAP